MAMRYGSRPWRITRGADVPPVKSHWVIWQPLFAGLWFYARGTMGSIEKDDALSR